MDAAARFYDAVLATFGAHRQADFGEAIGLGAEVLHAPPMRPEYHPGHYGAFVRDPDGDNVEAACHTAV